MKQDSPCLLLARSLAPHSGGAATDPDLGLCSREVAEYVPVIFSSDRRSAASIKRLLEAFGIHTLVESGRGFAGLPKRRIPVLVPGEMHEEASEIIARVEQDICPLFGDDEEVFDDDDDDYDEDETDDFEEEEVFDDDEDEI
jgi:hypothetical protein